MDTVKAKWDAIVMDWENGNRKDAAKELKSIIIQRWYVLEHALHNDARTLIEIIHFINSTCGKL